jgi:sulfate permease
MIPILTVIISFFLAMNMGASGFSISFAPSYGCGIIKKKKAVFLYTIFVLLGAVLIGPKVLETLTTKLVNGFDNHASGIIILLSASLTMFLANILKIPQSTSFVTVGAFTGAGLYYKNVNLSKLGEIFFIAILFSAMAFCITYALMKNFYPPSDKNFRAYEKFAANNKLVKNFILSTDCYSAFAVGTNNVANVVAPVIIAGFVVNSFWLLLFFAPFFGLGSFLLGRGVINTVSKEIVPLGEISAMIISLITSSFVIIASFLGLPTPYVQFTTFAVLGVSAIKDGIYYTTKKSVVKKVLLVWLIVPIIAIILSYCLHKIFV